MAEKPRDKENNEQKKAEVAQQEQITPLLRVAERNITESLSSELLTGVKSLDFVKTDPTFSDGFPAPVIRAAVGEWMRISREGKSLSGQVVEQMQKKGGDAAKVFEKGSDVSTNALRDIVSEALTAVNKSSWLQSDAAKWQKGGEIQRIFSGTEIGKKTAELAGKKFTSIDALAAYLTAAIKGDDQEIQLGSMRDERVLYLPLKLIQVYHTLSSEIAGYGVDMAYQPKLVEKYDECFSVKAFEYDQAVARRYVEQIVDDLLVQYGRQKDAGEIEAIKTRLTEENSKQQLAKIELDLETVKQKLEQVRRDMRATTTASGYLDQAARAFNKKKSRWIPNTISWLREKLPFLKSYIQIPITSETYNLGVARSQEMYQQKLQEQSELEAQVADLELQRSQFQGGSVNNLDERITEYRNIHDNVARQDRAALREKLLQIGYGILPKIATEKKDDSRNEKGDQGRKRGGN